MPTIVHSGDDLDLAERTKGGDVSFSDEWNPDWTLADSEKALTVAFTAALNGDLSESSDEEEDVAYASSSDSDDADEMMMEEDYDPIAEEEPEVDSDTDSDTDDEQELYEPEQPAAIVDAILPRVWPNDEQLEVQKKVDSGRWIMDEFELADDELERVIRKNSIDPAFGCDWMLEKGPGTGGQCQPCGSGLPYEFTANPLADDKGELFLSGRIHGGDIEEEALAKQATRHLADAGILSGITGRVNAAIASINGCLEEESLVLSFAEDKPHVSSLDVAFAKKLREQLRQRRSGKLSLSSRIKGEGDSDAVDPTAEGEGEGEEDMGEPVVLELSEEDKAIMSGDIKGVDPELLKAQAGNSVIVKKYREIGELLLEKASMKLDPKSMKPDKAKALFSSVIEDLVYSRVALALDPAISKTIEIIQYSAPELDPPQPLVLPTFLKNILQKAVDDVIEGQVREQVGKLVIAAVGLAAKVFQKAIPGLDESEEEQEEEDDDEGISFGDAAMAMGSGSGVALALGITLKPGEDPPKILEVIDEDTLNVILYAMAGASPFVKKYSKAAKAAQSEWFSMGGKDEIKANNRDNKRRKKGNKLKVKIPIYKFHKAGLAEGMEVLLKKIKKKDRETLEANGVVLEVPSDELVASEYLAQVDAIMSAWVIVVAKRTTDSSVDKKCETIAKQHLADGGAKSDAEGGKSGVRALKAEVHAKIGEMLNKESNKMLSDAFDEVGFKLVIPGTKPEKEAGEKSDGDDIGACKQCGKKLRTYGDDHPCFGEFGALDEWDCDVCAKSFGKDDVLYCCDTFDACDWGACVDCQVLIKPSAMDVESSAEKKKGAKEAAKAAKAAEKASKKNKKNKGETDVVDDFTSNPLAEDGGSFDADDVVSVRARFSSANLTKSQGVLVVPI